MTTSVKIAETSTHAVPARVTRMNYLIRIAILVVAVVVVMTLPGCGSFFKPCNNCPPVQPPPHFVYTANAAGNLSTVSALSADATTAVLTAVAGSPYNTGRDRWR